MAEKILFLTGKLAERQLKRILKIMKPEFSYKISQVGVSVAALMSENIIMRRVSKDKEIDKIIVPGKFRGDLEKLSKFFDVPVERGPDDISHLPDYFGLDSSKMELDEYECDIFAEIVDAAVLDVNEIIQIAKKYVSMGANVIDLGCMPDTDFKHLEDTIFKLKKIGLKVSVDSANSEELIRGGKAGADYLLSVNEKNFHIIDEVDSVPIIIPNTPGDMNSLDRAIEKMIKKKREFLADPILDPIHYGFTDSIVRYRDLRKKYPDVKILMGTGNLTELTDCDSAGANAILMGLVSELSINAVLVVQVSGHCRTSIKETDIARKKLDWWEEEISNALNAPTHPITIALRKPIESCSLPITDFLKIIGGVRQDLNHKPFASFIELEKYSDHVAGAVGRLSARIFGDVQNTEVLAYATQLGIACQFTNILRDITEDKESRRVYIPLELLQKYDLNFLNGKPTDKETVKSIDPYSNDFLKTWYDSDSKLNFLLAIFNCFKTTFSS